MASCSQWHQWGHFCACISGQGCCPWAALGAHFCSVRGLVNVDLVERGLNLVRALCVAEFVKTEVCCWLCVVIVVLFKCPTKFMLVCCSLCYLDYIRVDRGEGKNHSSCVLSAHFLMKSFFCEFLRSLLWRWLFRLGAVSSRISGSVIVVPGLSVPVWCILFIDLWALRHRQVLNTQKWSSWLLYLTITT